MWCKEGIEAIISTMGVPLEAEYIAIPWGHTLRACVMMDFAEELLAAIPVIVSRAGQESIRSIKVGFPV